MKLPRDVERKVLAQASQSANPGWPTPSEPYAEVTLPPSVNNLFATVGRRRVKSREYRDWLAVAVPIMARLRRVPPPYAIVVTVYGKVNQARDLDNALKGFGDSLVTAGVIEGDSVRWLHKWCVEYVPGEGEPRAVVTVLTHRAAV